LINNENVRNYHSVTDNNLILPIIIALPVLLFAIFMSNHDLFPYVEAQMNMDSFSAKGIIFSRLSESPLINMQDMNSSNPFNTITNTSDLNNTPSPTLNPSSNLPFLEGGWDLIVNKGEVNVFRAIFTLNQGEKVFNAFAIHNLKSNRYVQLNYGGNEIISGTVDFTSAGLKNGTLSNVEATISLTGLTQLRISLDNNNTTQYLDAPIVGETRLLQDANGNILIGPRPSPPPPPAQQPPGNVQPTPPAQQPPGNVQPTPPAQQPPGNVQPTPDLIPQSNSLLDPNMLHR
jgi:hypothetical protein